MIDPMLNLGVLLADELAMLRRNWGWYFALGLLFTVLGVAGLAYAGLATLLSVLFVGWAFLIAGSAEVIHAIIRKGWSGFWLDLLSGLITTLAGLFILLRPEQGASVLTMVIGVVFLVGGILRVIAGIAVKNPYRGWFIFHGIISTILGVMIVSEWPYSSVWVIGTLVAIDLLFEGFRLMSFSLAVRKLPRPESMTPAA